MILKSKKVRKNFVLGIIFISCIVTLNLFFNSAQVREDEKINIEYFDPDINSTISYDKTIHIFKPNSINIESEPVNYPAVILIHGDLVDSAVMNNLKLEFLQNNYLVVLLNIEFNYKTFFELNATLNYLQMREDVNSNQIGMFGQSHGAHYAYLFSTMIRNESINAVVCSNSGPNGEILLDYYEYFDKFIDLNKTWDKQTFLNNYSIPISSTNPKNLLLISDIYNPDDLTYEYNYEGKINLWDIPESNQFYGDFQNGSARELNIRLSIFFHASGVIDPNYLHKQVSWMNQAFGFSNSSNNYFSVLFRAFTTITLFFLIFITGIYLSAKILSFLPSITLILSLIILTFLFILSVILTEPLWIIITLTVITASFFISLTENDKFWIVKTQYSECNYVVKHKPLTKSQETKIKAGVVMSIIIQMIMMSYFFSNPDFANFLLLFILYILIILPYQLQYYYNKLIFSRKDRKAYREIAYREIHQSS
jgi:hypothetical protein